MDQDAFTIVFLIIFTVVTLAYNWKKNFRMEFQAKRDEDLAIKRERIRLLLAYAIAHNLQVKVLWSNTQKEGKVKEFQIADNGNIWMEFEDSSPHSLNDAKAVELNGKLISFDENGSFEKFFIPELDSFYPNVTERIGGYSGSNIRASQIGWNSINPEDNDL